MNRFTQKRKSSHMLRRMVLTVIVFFCAVVLLLFGSSSVRDTADASQLDSLRQAILRSAVHCYAMEGTYPESLDYIKEHYGIDWDSTKYVVDYEITGANLRPDVSVFKIKGREGKG